MSQGRPAGSHRALLAAEPCEPAGRRFRRRRGAVGRTAGSRQRAAPPCLTRDTPPASGGRLRAARRDGAERPAQRHRQRNREDGGRRGLLPLLPILGASVQSSARLPSLQGSLSSERQKWSIVSVGLLGTPREATAFLQGWADVTPCACVGSQTQGWVTGQQGCWPHPGPDGDRLNSSWKKSMPPMLKNRVNTFNFPFRGGCNTLGRRDCPVAPTTPSTKHPHMRKQPTKHTEVVSWERIASHITKLQERAQPC